ncbi:MAG: hypothetical protein K2W96_00160 [Gemmataceae bacterium]|nr:hypothetical protein [Gemmataceae bacterium]
MFGWLFRRRQQPPKRPAGICPGCRYPIKGTLRPASWEEAGDGAEREEGALYAYRCPSCMVALHAWDPSGRPTADDRRLLWSMRAVRTPGGRTITQQQVTAWSRPARAGADPTKG